MHAYVQPCDSEVKRTIKKIIWMKGKFTGKGYRHSSLRKDIGEVLRRWKYQKHSQFLTIHYKHTFSPVGTILITTYLETGVLLFFATEFMGTRTLASGK